MPTASFNLSDLDGSNGFVINGLNPGNYLGYAVSNAGDINGDGIDDLIIGAPYADPNGITNAGSTYVVFGGTNVGEGGSIDSSSLDGSNGFASNSVNAGDRFGNSVSSAGDVNNDGIDDFIIGNNPTSRSSAIKSVSYVVFGGTQIGADGNFDISSLDGSNGFVIDGVADSSVTDAGDINGDGIDDLIIGQNLFSRSRSVYVVFGGTELGASGSFDASSLDGSNGFVIDYLIDDYSFYNLVVSSGAGDVNGDGFADLIIGSPELLNYEIDSVSYVVFGGTNVAENGRLTISELDGSNGFAINGVAKLDRLGSSVSAAGDINGDGIDDLIIDAPGGRYLYYANYSSKCYVVFGGTDIATTGSDLSALDGSNGFVINGISFPDESARRSVSNAGDINADGIADLMISAPGAGINGRFSGSTYIVFGGVGVGAGGSFELSDLDGSNGFVLNGIKEFDSSGFSVSAAGDVNADGIADVIIGAPYADANGVRSGSSYVVFGSPVSVAEPTSGNDTLLGTNAGDLIRGLAGDDWLNGRNGNDRLRGNQGNDTLIGGNGDDRLFGGWGHDILTGGVGSDSFLLAQNTGTDTIDDFESGIDSLVLLGNSYFDRNSC
jgi:Ca2+-binding RTX toxin-like protein